MLNQVIFYFLSIKLSRSDNSGHEFGGLTRVVFYILFLIDFFFNFILQNWADWGLEFVIYFYLFSMGLSRFYELGWKFDMLTQVAF
jgi:hypothetical protein